MAFTTPVQFHQNFVGRVACLNTKVYSFLQVPISTQGSSVVQAMFSTHGTSEMSNAAIRTNHKIAIRYYGCRLAKFIDLLTAS